MTEVSTNDRVARPSNHRDVSVKRQTPIGRSTPATDTDDEVESATHGSFAVPTILRLVRVELEAVLRVPLSVVVDTRGKSRRSCIGAGNHSKASRIVRIVSWHTRSTRGSLFGVTVFAVAWPTGPSIAECRNATTVLAVKVCVWERPMWECTRVT